jgi:hypothetical protein
MARRDIILSLVFSTKILQWRISVISKNSDKLFVKSPLVFRSGIAGLMIDITKY